MEDVKVLQLCIPGRPSVGPHCYLPGQVGIVELLAALLVPTFFWVDRRVPSTPDTCTIQAPPHQALNVVESRLLGKTCLSISTSSAPSFLVETW